MENGYRLLSEQDIATVSTTKQVEYGAMGVTADGRKFRYIGYGGTTTVAPGTLLQAAVGATNSTALAITATTVATTIPAQTTASLTQGSTYIVLTNGATAVTQDEFAEGFLDILQTSGTNEGPIKYRILGNTKAAASTGYIGVYLYEPLRNQEVLVPGTDTANIWASPHAAPIVTTTVNIPIGINLIQAVNTSSVTNYGWVQTWGPCMGVQDGSSMVIGNTVGPSTTTSGNVGLAVAATKPAIGWSQQTVSTGGAGVSIFLGID
jgi:hypothetical protein